jgi:hypothetical protein
MIFHVRKPSDPGFGPGTTDGRPQYQARRGAVIGAAIALVALFAIAFGLWKAGWNDGSDKALHFADLLFGAVIGMFFGERTALAETQNNNRST